MRRRSPRSDRGIVRTGRVLLAAFLLAHGGASVAMAALDEAGCRADLYKAAGVYGRCTQLAEAKWRLLDEDYLVLNEALGKCARKYGERWTKLQAKYLGTGVPCDGDRFVDNGDGTVSDRLTRLQWEQKVNDGSIHHYQNQYTWGIYPPPTAVTDAANGTVFTVFRRALGYSPGNPDCFAQQCDWRLPTRDELLTIVSPTYPACTVPPCIDAVFNPGLSEFHGRFMTAAPIERTAYPVVTSVDFYNGVVEAWAYNASLLARAVRGGL